MMISACATAVPESAGENLGSAQETLLTTACSTSGGNLTLQVKANEVGYVGKVAGCTVEPCVFANALDGSGNICRINSTGKTITVTNTGTTGVEKMVVDYANGLFALAATTPLVSVSLDTGSKLMVIPPVGGGNMALGATGLDANTLAARGAPLVDISMTGVDFLFNGGAGNDTFTADAAGWTTAPTGWATGAAIAAAVGAASPLALTVSGGAGNDTLAGGAGTNSLLGGAGNDTFVQSTSARAETISGGDGIDTVDYGARTAPVGVSVGANGGLSTVALGASGGVGYVVGEVLTLAGGAGGTVTVATVGISGLSVGSGGSGYAMGEVLTIAAPGTGGTATVTGTGIATAAVAAGGTGYVVGEVLTVAGGTGGTVTVATTAASPIASVALGGSGGTGYVVGEVLTIAGGTGGTATVTSESGGVITGLSLTAPGTGYQAATNAATTADLAGTGATVTITNAGVVATVSLTSAGSSTTWPSVGNATTSNLAGTGATITVSSASVATVTVTTAGSGYVASTTHATTSNLAGTSATLTIGAASAVASVTVTKPGSGYLAAVGKSTKSNLAGTGALITISTAVAADDGDLAAGEGDTVMSDVEIIKGGAGNDALTAYAITNTDVVLIGNAGNDTLTGGGGNDDLCGGAGDDTFMANAGNDNLVGGAGIDTADYSTATGVVACLNAADTAATKPCAAQNGPPGQKDVVNAVLTKVCPRATLTVDVGGVPTAGVAVPTTMQGGAMAVDVENLTGHPTSANALYCGTLACTLFGGSAGDILQGGAAGDIIIGQGGTDAVKTNGGTDLVDLTHAGSGVAVTVDCNNNQVTILKASLDTITYPASNCSSANMP